MNSKRLPAREPEEVLLVRCAAFCGKPRSGGCCRYWSYSYSSASWFFFPVPGLHRLFIRSSNPHRATVQPATGEVAVVFGRVGCCFRVSEAERGQINRLEDAGGKITREQAGSQSTTPQHHARPIVSDARSVDCRSYAKRQLPVSLSSLGLSRQR